LGTIPSPHTWTVGEYPTSANMNGIRDAINFFVNAPSCRAYNSAALTVANNTFTQLTFNSERHDNDGIHSTVSNTGRLTCVTAGNYVIDGGIEWAAVNTTGVRQVGIRLNGTTWLKIQQIPALNTVQQMSVETSYKLAATDWVELVALQTSGGNLNVNASGNYSPEFAMTWTSAA
jgi:hypothetical protein